MANPDDLWDIPVAFRFEVSFSGTSRSIDATAFQEVSGLDSTIDVETVTEGGVNDFQHRLPKPVKQGTIKLRRGLEPARDDLVTWCKDTIEGGLMQKIEPMNIVIKLLDREGGTQREFSVQNAWPIKWEVGAFDAMKNELVIETLELACNQITRT
jgi:phage tail-like protein